MTASPKVVPMNVVAQGGHNFPWTAQWIDNVVIPNNAAVSYNVTALRAAAGLQAGQALFLIFSADAPFWACFNGGTAAVPSGNVSDGTGSEFSPTQRYIDETITSISFASANGANLSIEVHRP
jgi:hypothetical protein